MTPLPAERVRAQLARMLGSRAFGQAERLRKFLQFVVDVGLDADAPPPKEYVIAIEVCGRSPDFDPAADPIVRVDANRLRSRLMAYYASEGRDDAIEIALPKGSYVARFAARATAAEQAGAVGAVDDVGGAPGVAGDGAPRTAAGGAADVATGVATGVAGPAIAVLPFVNLRTDRETDFFSDGLTEELINLLSRTAGLRVVARTSVFQFKGQAIDVREIGRRLAVTHVLEGSVREAQGRIRVTAQLTDAHTGWLLWSEKFERALVELFAIQDEICASLAAALRVRLMAGVSASRPSDVEAHRWYLRGRHHWNRRTPASLETSVTCYRAAIERDPAYALPYGGLADSLTVQAINEHADPAVVMPQATAYASRARDLGPDLPEPHVSSAFIKGLWDWEWDAAEADFTRAIALSPGSVTAHYLYAVVNLAPRGRWDDALRAMREALSLDPISPVLRRDLGLIHYARRDYAQAEIALREAHDLDPAFVGHFFWLARTLAEQGRFDEADAALQTRAASAPNTQLLAVLAHTRARMGRRDLAEGALAEMQRGGPSPVRELGLAIVLLGLDRHEAALEHLSRAADRRTLALYQLAVDPLYDPLRDRPRFDALLQRMRLPRLSFAR